MLSRNIATFSSALRCQSVRTLATAQPAGTSSYRTVAGVILQRHPVVTREPTEFERAYYAYQDEMQRRRAAPFAAEFYFKKGSTGEKDWKQRQKEYKDLVKSGWKNLLENSPVFAPYASTTEQQGKSGQAGSTDDAVTLTPRTTEADTKGDIKSLDRALAEPLYLLVKKPRKEHTWQFPQGGVDEGELLHQAALRELAEECGNGMDVWLAGRGPIGHYCYDFPKDFAASSKTKGAKVFFMRGHIMAGQVKVDNQEIVDFAWLTKAEIPQYVDKAYWEAVRDLL
ncbi:hypothetical protein IWQ62_000594 [Dispira parvispora]|uniref:Large ribosomal subunit protein mL46 n=1 Tax=Dispira parvispora TaxID=1520584 RepID=A0A9W8AY17_9FUNG|nr:hypothetical protein IWQ62_000594 [Dispira parvispora]